MCLVWMWFIGFGVNCFLSHYHWVKHLREPEPRKLTFSAFLDEIGVNGEGLDHIKQSVRLKSSFEVNHIGCTPKCGERYVLTSNYEIFIKDKHLHKLNERGEAIPIDEVERKFMIERDKRLQQEFNKMLSLYIA